MKSKYSDMELAYFVSWYQRLADIVQQEGREDMAEDIRYAAYRRVRFDKQNKNFYVLSDGKPVTVFIGSIE